MIIDKKLVDNQKIYSFKNIFLFIFLTCAIIQFLISDTKFNLILFFLFIITFFTFNIFFNINYLTNFFFPTFIVISLNISMISGPIIFKTLLYQTFDSYLLIPKKTYLNLCLYQIIANLSLYLFVNSINLKKLSSKFGKILEKIDIFEYPTLKTNFFLFVLFSANKFYLNYINLTSISEVGNIFLKTLVGIEILFYFPLVVFLKLFLIDKKINFIQISLITSFYIIAGLLTAFATNSRSDFYQIIFILFFFTFVFYLFNKKNNFIIILISIIILFILITSSWINTAILSLRDVRSEVSRTELLKLSLENKQENQIIIDQDILSEDYTGYAMFDRFILIKYFDKSLYLSDLFTESVRANFIAENKNLALSVIPQTFINLFNPDFNKKNYQFSSGTLIERMSGYNFSKYSLGSIFVESKILYKNFNYVIFSLYLIIAFIYFNAFQKNEENSVVFSPIIIPFSWWLYHFSGLDGLHHFLTLFREVIQATIIYFLIFKLINLFTNNKNEK